MLSDSLLGTRTLLADCDFCRVLGQNLVKLKTPHVRPAMRFAPTSTTELRTV